QRWRGELVRLVSRLGGAHVGLGCRVCLQEEEGGHPGEPDQGRATSNTRFSRAKGHRTTQTHLVHQLEGTLQKVSSLGKDWHKFCLKCERCNKTLTPGGHAEHDGKPFCHKPCYATLFGPKGVNIGGAGSYIYEKPVAEGPQVTGPIEVPVARAEERKASGPPKGPSKAQHVSPLQQETEKVTSLGKDWHRPCLRCERCGKTLTPGGHAEHDGQPYCHKPCYGILFGPKGVNTGAVGSYIYDRDPEGKVQP
uniref:Cysteine rich protein 2 n=1 Tax=Microcebus murinus TaxID=30608 RepID=A0A8C5Y7M8_MICMU